MTADTIARGSAERMENSMGTFSYAASLKADFDDRLLAHLQMVISAKLRRGESFNFSWKDDVSIGDGRTTIWLHPSVPVIYKYSGGRAPVINRNWIEALSASADSAAGLQVMPEPPEGHA